VPTASPQPSPARSRRGAATVELALVLPFLLLFGVAVVEVGLLLSASMALSNAAQAGALYGAQSNAFAADTAGIRIAAQRDAPQLGAFTVTSSRSCRCPPTSGSAEVTVTCTTSCGAYGPPRVYVQVTASTTVKLLFANSIFSSAASMKRTSTIRSQ